jgi:hypothetical protein
MLKGRERVYREGAKGAEMKSYLLLVIGEEDEAASSFLFLKLNTENLKRFLKAPPRGGGWGTWSDGSIKKLLN